MKERNTMCPIAALVKSGAAVQQSEGDGGKPLPAMSAERKRLFQ